MSGFVKIEKREYENIPNLSADVKQEYVDANVNYPRRESYESYWQEKCEVLERKVRRLENEITSLKTKKTHPPAPKATAAPYSDPLLKAFFCPKLPETELTELRQEKKEMIANLARMKNENIQVGFLIRC